MTFTLLMVQGYTGSIRAQGENSAHPSLSSVYHLLEQERKSIGSEGGESIGSEGGESIGSEGGE